MSFSGLPSNMDDIRRLLREAVARVQARVGEFLQQKQRLLIMERRISALSKVPQTSSSSAVLLGRSQALLSENRILETDSLTFVREANDLHMQLTTSPTWRPLKNLGASFLGWEVLSRVRAMAEDVAAALKNLNNIQRRINDHISGVNDLESEVEDAERFAMGKGLRATASSLITGYRDLFKGPLMIGAAVGGLYLAAQAGVFTKKR